MPRTWTLLAGALLLLAARPPLDAQRPFSGTPEIVSALERLNVTASALMIAAHPDDENTALLAWFARGRGARTAYLSLTRGEGGQNLIGPELGAMLGLLRTQELLAARRIDGAEQLFTRAIDFGFSKTPEETMAKWGRERVLGDVVWAIRRFRPDVIVLRFSGSSRDGHGHHTASAILGREAFAAAADPTRRHPAIDIAPAGALADLDQAFFRLGLRNVAVVRICDVAHRRSQRSKCLYWHKSITFPKSATWSAEPSFLAPGGRAVIGSAGYAVRTPSGETERAI